MAGVTVRRHGSPPDRLEGLLVPFLVVLLFAAGLAVAAVAAVAERLGVPFWSEDGGWF